MAPCDKSRSGRASFSNFKEAHLEVLGLSDTAHGGKVLPRLTEGRVALKDDAREGGLQESGVSVSRSSAGGEGNARPCIRARRR